MKRTLTASLLVLAIAFAPGVAVAKGCIKGALVGGVAGHATGHGTFTGAVLGCITGRTVAKGQKMREQQRTQEQARRAQPTEVGTAAAPARVPSGTTYMYAPPHRSTEHRHKIMPKSEDRVPTGE